MSIMRQQAWILLAAACVFLTNLGGPGLWDDDEPKNAECAREMFERNDWVVPTFNGELRTDKPILLYWLMLASYHLLGVSEFSARIVSALIAMGTVLLTARLGRRLFSPAVGLWSGLALASCLMFGVSARAATPDATFIFCITLCLSLFAEGVRQCWPGQLEEQSGGLPRLTSSRWLSIYAVMGLAALAKGPAGIVLPLGVMGLFSLCCWTRHEPGPSTGSWWRDAARLAWLTFSPARVACALWNMRPLSGLLVAGAVALPWYVLVALRTDGAWPAGFLGTHNVSRFLKPMEGHGGPVVYYPIAILVGCLPWSLFLPGGVQLAFRQVRRHDEQAPNPAWPQLFALCWIGLFVGFFSLARTKLPSYVLPCYPALALVIGQFVAEWIRHPTSIPRAGMRLTLGLGIAVGLGFSVALPIAAHFVLPGEAGLGWAGAIPMIGCAVAWRLAERNRVPRAAAAFAVMAVIMATSLFGIAAPRVDAHQNSEVLVRRVRELGGPTARIGTFDCFRPSLVYYARQTVADCDSIEAAVRFLTADPRAYLIARGRELERIEALLPREVVVLDRQPFFLRRNQDLVLLGRPGPQPPLTLRENATRSTIRR